MRVVWSHTLNTSWVKKGESISQVIQTGGVETHQNTPVMELVDTLVLGTRF